MPVKGKAKLKLKVKVGDAISVYWPDDLAWYDGVVKSFDARNGTCEVLYDDGETEELNLLKEKYKIKAGGKGVELIDRVLANAGDVSKQLEVIGSVLRDICDRVPNSGCCTTREGFWIDWQSSIEVGVKTGNVIALVKATYELGCQLRPNITTAWWVAEALNWRGCLRNVKTCEELVNCVEDLRVKGIDWKITRQLFTAPSTSIGV